MHNFLKKFFGICLTLLLAFNVFAESGILQYVTASTTKTWSPLDLAPLAWWKLDGNALDSASTNNGVLVTGVVSTNGYTGASFFFKPASASIIVMSSPIITGGNNSISITAWVNPSSSFTSWGGICESYISGSAGIVFRLQGDRTVAFTQNGTEAATTTAVAVEKNVWSFVAATYDMTTYERKIYINAVLRASASSNKATLRYTMAIGRDYTDRYFYGNIDDVCFFNRALTIEEIQIMYEKAQERNGAPW